MRAAMAAAEVGDDCSGEDPTVNELQDVVAGTLGKESALFVASGTQGNLCALLAHCGRGDEYIVGDRAHAYMYEGGGAAVLGSIQPQPVPTRPDGMIDLEAAATAVKADDPHFARTRLLCLENTIDGHALELEQMAESADLAERRGLAHHLDGARLWNAAVQLGAAPAAVAAAFDSVSVCLSKGLGAPVGSLLAGSAALIEEAHKWRKMLGGGMRQAGVVAAAGLHAVKHNMARLAEDHGNAARLAEGLRSIDGVEVESQNTNMVFVHVSGRPASQQDGRCGEQSDDAAGTAIQRSLEERGVLTWWHGPRARLVTHLDISSEDIDTAVGAFHKLGLAGA